MSETNKTMKKSVEDVDVKDKRVLVRVDFNVPLEDGKITDDTRIKGALPTIQYLIDHGAKVILMSHLGRPKGEVNKKYSLEPVAERLSELLKKPVKFVDDCVGPDAEAAVAEMKDGDVVLLENLRFHKEETANDKEFSKKLASLADIYVNDAFGTAHRAHASTVGVTEFLPAYMGYLLEQEVWMLGRTLENPERPFVAVLGGAKISDKIGVISNLMKKVDTLIIGGGMANTFVKAQGNEVGRSLVDDDSLDTARRIMDEAKQAGVQFMLPVDFVVAKEVSADAPTEMVSVDAIPADEMALDIGPNTQKEYADVIKKAKTVVWNGPMGVAEIPQFAKGTEALAKAMSEVDGVTIVGGGDSVAAVKALGFGDKISHISTGGGASLELLEGKELPGVAVIEDKQLDS